MEWKTLHSEYLYQTPFGSLRKDTCALPNGIRINDYYVQEHSDWVNAIVLTCNLEIVLVCQYRHGAGRMMIEVPAGKPEEGELKADAIIREVEEETGYTTSSRPVLLGESYVNPALQNNKVFTYLVKNAVQTKELNLDDTEQIEVMNYSLSDFQEGMEHGEINQLFTIHAYHLAKSYGAFTS